MRTGGRALVETTFSLDIRPLVRAGAIRDDVHADGKMKFGPPTTTTLSPSPSRCRPSTARIAGCGCAAPSPIGGPASGATSTTKFPSPQSATRAVGGEWCFVCPAQGWRVRKLYLPAGARHFRSRQAYDLAYETEHLDDRERAWRRVRKCRRQLGSDPDGTRPALP